MTELFIASEDDLNCLEDRLPADSQLAGMVDSEIDLIMLCNLESILTGVDWESVFDRVYVNPVRDEGPDGPWIYEVSSCLLEALQNLTADALLDCAIQWAETDEWTLCENITPEKIAEVLDQLIRLARLAGLERKSLFIWTQP